MTGPSRTECPECEHVEVRESSGAVERLVTRPCSKHEGRPPRFDDVASLTLAERAIYEQGRAAGAEYVARRLEAAKQRRQAPSIPTVTYKHRWLHRPKVVRSAPSGPSCDRCDRPARWVWDRRWLYLCGGCRDAHKASDDLVFDPSLWGVAA